jgi:hypothetical protein
MSARLIMPTLAKDAKMGQRVRKRLLRGGGREDHAWNLHAKHGRGSARPQGEALAAILHQPSIQPGQANYSQNHGLATG